MTAAFFQKNLLFKNKAPIFALKMTYNMNKLIKLLFLSLAIIGLHLSSAARPVDLQTAQSIAIKFMATNNLQLTATYQTDKNAAAFYVFNTTDGFVIVSADDCETPIIGYSREGCFDPDNVPVQMEDYLQDFVVRLQYGIENQVVADAVTTRQWELVKATGRLNERKDTQAVGPLLTEKWHQGCLYNSLCPEKNGPCGHAEVGCVAVAMGQIMHYWGYPATGWSSNSYNNWGVQLSADFGNTAYDWAHMPDSLTENSSEVEIEAVATMLYHCGISVNMNYSNNGSTASSIDVPYALLRYFNYSRAIHMESLNDFSNEEWLSMIKSNLNLQKPVYYSGKGSAGGHAFVCDGYDADDLLHFNWGWGGNGDGYFALGHLNPIGYQFNSNNAVILDIIPEYEPCHVVPTVYPPTSGSVTGAGDYHYGDSCTLTAVPAEHCEFYCWKRNGQVITFKPTYTIDLVEDDIEDIEANFTLNMPQQITASHYPDANDPESPSISLLWELQNPNYWMLLKEFDVEEIEDGVGTDGEYIYTSCSYSFAPVRFGKYSMDGDLLETFTIEGCQHSPVLAFDGNYFYFISIRTLQCVDFVHKTLINNVHVQESINTLCVFDPISDGFWIPYYRSTGQTKRLKLIDHNGQTIREGPLLSPTIPYNQFPYGSCYMTAKDGTQHLLISSQGKLYDYNITNDILRDHYIMDFHHGSKGACIGTFEGKEALFIIYSNKVHIYEISHHLSQIIGYRIYRSDIEGNTVLLADRIVGNSFIDNSWSQTFAGTYRFGISSVFANGNESEIIWSNPIESPFDGIEENDGNQQVPEQPVQKIIENGQIIIIKDGKRYSVSGQRLK